MRVCWGARAWLLPLALVWALGAAGCAANAAPMMRKKSSGSSGAATVRPAAQPPAARPPAPAADPVAWGAAVGGVKAGLQPGAARFPSGGEMSFTVHLQNAEGKALQLRAGSIAGWRLVFTPAGGDVPRTLRMVGSDPGPGADLALDSKASAAVPIVIKPDWWAFKDASPGGTKPELAALPPGKYSVTASHANVSDHAQGDPCPYWHGQVTSGAVEIEIVAR